MSATQKPGPRTFNPADYEPPSNGCCCTTSVAAVAFAILAIVAVSVCLYYKFPDHKSWIILGGGVSILVSVVAFACFGNRNNPFQDVVVPPVGEPTAPPVSQYSFVRDFLNNYQHIRIAGDGHCFFRAAGLGFLTLYEACSAADKAAIIQRFQEFRAQPQYAAITAHIDTVLHLLQSKGSPKEKMEDNRMVFALRELVCAYNMGQPDRDVFVAQAAEYSGSLDQYLLKMRTTDIMAGDAERLALSKVLGLEVTIYDSNLKAPQPADFLAIARPGQPLTPTLQDAAITLYYINKHYNSLIPNGLARK